MWPFIRYEFYKWRGVLVLLLIAGVAAVALSLMAPEPKAPSPAEPPPLADRIREGTTSIPPYTPRVAAKVRASQGFEYLVSYTDGGFEPQQLAVESESTIRFTNNSSERLWVSATDSLYPQTRPGCGSSDVDSCVPLDPMDFWEFRFVERGDWVVHNNLRKELRMTVRVY